jgi:hypothetical protein
VLVLGLNGPSLSLYLTPSTNELSLVVLSDVHALPSAVPDVDQACSGADATLAEKCDSVCDSVHQVDPMHTHHDISCICADPSTQSLLACFQCNLEATNASLDPELRTLMESVLAGKLSFFRERVNKH